jgi:transposase-like protein
VTKARGSFPNDEAVSKLLYLVLAQYCEEMYHAAAHLEGRAQSLRHHLREHSRRKPEDDRLHKILDAAFVGFPT